jgi:hypothetical protein
MKIFENELIRSGTCRTQSDYEKQIGNIDPYNLVEPKNNTITQAVNHTQPCIDRTINQYAVNIHNTNHEIK